MLELRAVPGDTGRLMRELLTERGVRIGAPGDAIVSWGVRVRGDVPVLNGRAGTRDKLEELTVLRDSGVLVPPFSLDGEGLEFPILGRKRHHTQARDIVPVLENDREFEWRRAGGASDYFVQYVAKQAEYRVWAYRRRPLASYEKVLRYPERYTRVGWNWQHGFAFEFVREAPDGLQELGARAVDAMGLDFGAVDILAGKDGRLYVLEVNTAPGVQGARQGVRRLADKIAKWVTLGYPRRRGDGD